ncbi:MAG TPA: LuxR C-terminal-related transcriptional regulator [Gemmataceae bacterium]|jgi:DNA-binding CsgD family transcriptional regulator|nr:LuxR C-terminal-related transcriptional regulator [Gemmataceae bacterium]
MNVAKRKKPKSKPSDLSPLEQLFGLRVCDARGLLALLTHRETEVVESLMTGRKPRVLAAELGISPKTLDIHRANIFRKIRIRNVVKLTQLIDLIRVAEAFPQLPATREGELRFPPT